MYRFQKLFRIFIPMLIILCLVATAWVPPYASKAKAHPLLLQIAGEHPDQQVAVIVLKLAKDRHLEARVAQFGGEVTKNLHIINAFAARLAAGKAVELAMDPGVRWVSLDAPVQSASLVYDSVEDNFELVSYNNNTGTMSWTSGWSEYGDDNLPASGGVNINNGNLVISNKNKSIQRQADLSGVLSAQLSFDYKRSGMKKSYHYVTLQISPDGGATWNDLGQFSGPAKDNNFIPASFDIHPYTSDQFVVRFVSSSSFLGDFYIDNVRIEFSWEDGLSTTYVMDSFNSVSFEGSSGTQPWNNAWTEEDPQPGGEGPASGFVKVVDGKLSLDNDWSSNQFTGVKRAVDLSGAVQATLSFRYQMCNGVNGSEGVAVRISPDAGATFYQIDTLTGLTAGAIGTRSYDITKFANLDTVISLYIDWGFLYDDQCIYFDDVRVSYVVSDGTPPLPLQSSGDDFEATPARFDNNTGTRYWLTEWQEINESDGPDTGHVKIVDESASKRLMFWTQKHYNVLDAPVVGVWRLADLSGATTARLSLIYKKDSLNPYDSVSIQASQDGGYSWAEVGRIDGGNTNFDVLYHYQEYDISNFISANTGIRLITSFADEDYYDSVFIDNIEIIFNAPAGPMPENVFPQTLNIEAARSLGLDGSGVTIAVIDSGISRDLDFSSLPGAQESGRLLLQLNFAAGTQNVQDAYGHGTHVAGIIAGNGSKSGGVYQGIAPGADLISLRVSDDFGIANESDVVAALQWVLDNKDTYNIRVVNLSLNSTQIQLYHTSPLDAAVEILWFNGIVVVASSGNHGDGNYDFANTAPANDPFVITVGASDESETTDPGDDVIGLFSAFGLTLSGHFKPDIIAPGRNIISILASSSWWRNDFPERAVAGEYFRISGTSMAAPMVSGAVALLLQNEPYLTPDQVKYRLIHASGRQITRYLNNYPLYTLPYLDLEGILSTSTTQSANTSLIASQLLWTGSEPITWGSVAWNSVAWNSVAWNSVAWNSVAWNSVAWNSVYWGP
jgi:serine protease AprX